MSVNSWGCKFYRALLKTETALLVVLLVALILIAVVQIFMRNVLDSGFFWAESFIRIAVLWITLVGAMIGSRKGQHIAIDALVRHLSTTAQRLMQRLTDAFTATICFIMTYFSYRFVKMEFEDGGIAFGVVPNWLCEAIIPFALLVIASRYLIAAVFAIRHEKS